MPANQTGARELAVTSTTRAVGRRRRIRHGPSLEDCGRVSASIDGWQVVVTGLLMWHSRFRSASTTFSRTEPVERCAEYSRGFSRRSRATLIGRTSNSQCSFSGAKNWSRTCSGLSGAERCSGPNRNAVRSTCAGSLLAQLPDSRPFSAGAAEPVESSSRCDTQPGIEFPLRALPPGR